MSFIYNLREVCNIFSYIGMHYQLGPMGMIADFVEIARVSHTNLLQLVVLCCFMALVQHHYEKIN